MTVREMGQQFTLNRDKASCHTSLPVRRVPSHKNVAVCPHPPYSPHLALCDVRLLPKVQVTTTGECSELTQDIEAAATARLTTLREEDIPNGFREWQGPWDTCARSEGT